MDAVTFRIVLDEAGYYDSPATEEAVREMFADYVDGGYWSNVDTDDVEDYSTQEICSWFLKEGRRLSNA